MTRDRASECPACDTAAPPEWDPIMVRFHCPRCSTTWRRPRGRLVPAVTRLPYTAPPLTIETELPARRAQLPGRQAGYERGYGQDADDEDQTRKQQAIRHEGRTQLAVTSGTDQSSHTDLRVRVHDTPARRPAAQIVEGSATSTSTQDRAQRRCAFSAESAVQMSVLVGGKGRL